MILIDGRETDLTLSNYANLEEVLSSIMDGGSLDQRIVTDVLVDDESFSELYPHQAEDIDIGSFSRLELRTVSFQQMAGDVAEELPKVLDIMDAGGKKVSELLRQSELYEGLEILQDILAVSRDYLNTLNVLRSEFSNGKEPRFNELTEKLSGVLEEIAESMSNADWMLVADLFEYEYLPACQGWREIIADISKNIQASEAA